MSVNKCTKDELPILNLLVYTVIAAVKKEKNFMD